MPISYYGGSKRKGVAPERQHAGRTTKHNQSTFKESNRSVLLVPQRRPAQFGGF